MIDRMETGNTEETGTPSNGEFLRTLFGLATIDQPLELASGAHR